jgi:2,4-dienoyl-CoA reductase-like NADH-dependent reductase (Old Yellow Enzyme family)
MSEIDALLQSVALRRLRLANRIAVAPMTRISATPRGVATGRMRRYYERFAHGGFALIITEGTYTDCAFSQGYAGQPGLSNEEQALAWRGVVDAVREASGLIFAQLMHAGALSQANRFRDETVGASAVQPVGQQLPAYRGQGAYRLPRAMSEPEIEEAIEGFARAARLAIEVAGFDGVEIHGANGYLIDQFLSEHTNIRSDAWGGSPRNRVRLAVEIARAVRNAVGDGVPVGIRISQAKVNDGLHRWTNGIVDAHVIFSELATAPLDFMHLTEPEAWQPAFAHAPQSLVSCARAAAPHFTIIANGGLHAPERALQVLKHGADVISLGRGALANPDWPQRIRARRVQRSFDPALLRPLADIKDTELDFARDLVMQWGPAAHQSEESL